MTREKEITLLEWRIKRYKEVIVDCIAHNDVDCEILCKKQLKKCEKRLEEL